MYLPYYMYVCQVEMRRICRGPTIRFAFAHPDLLGCELGVGVVCISERYATSQVYHVQAFASEFIPGFLKNYLAQRFCPRCWSKKDKFLGVVRVQNNRER